MLEKKVLSPINIGKMRLKNRVYFPSMCTFFGDVGGFVGEDQYSLVRGLAEGGTGLIIVPGSPHGKPGPGRPALSDDKFIPGWKTMADIAHEHDARLVCQLHPAAVQAGRDLVVKKVEDYPKDMLEMLVNSYAEEAYRCKIAGVDGVEIHGAHAHEIAQFMSPHYNHRTDEYGGDYIGRSKYSYDICKAIKEKCGKDYPLIFRISGDEMVEGGRKIDETILIIKRLIEAGIDAVHVSVAMPESEEWMCAPMDVNDCFNTWAAKKVKEAINGCIPVITVGRITTVEEAEDILERGDADITAIGRAQLVDHALVNKYAGINREPVCHCVGCNQGCRDTTVRKKIRCMQNAYVGYDAEFALPAISEKVKNKKIMIVGAGPAGLQAAMILAKNGVKPVVYEKSDKVGGLINLAAIPPHKKNMLNIVDYRSKMMDYLGVDIRFNTEVDVTLIEKENPDIIIMATGSDPLCLKIPGLENYVTGDQAIENTDKLGKHVAIIGGGLIGCETAELLAEAGKDVTVFEMLPDVAKELTVSRRIFMMKRLTEKVNIYRNATVKNVNLPTVVIEQDGIEKVVEGFDSVVMAAGRTANVDLIRDAKNLPAKTRIFTVGDAVKPALAIDAIHNATAVAVQILKGNF